MLRIIDIKLDELNKYTTYYNSARQLVSNIDDIVDKSHQLGDWEFRDVNRRDLGVRGTMTGAFGFLPSDTGRCHLVTIKLPTINYTIRTYSWTQDDDGEPLWKRIMDRAWFDELKYRPSLKYPQLNFPANVGLCYDPDPPNPGLHESGLQAELNYWKSDSAFFPHIAQQKALMEHVIRKWYARVTTLIAHIDDLRRLDLN